MSVSLKSSKDQTQNPFSHFLDSVSSYDGNVMLAAIISLLLVILFVLLLHAYAKWFLAQARQRNRSSFSSSSMSISQVFRPDRFHHFHAFTFDTTFPNSQSKGLDSSVISSIPRFVYKMEEFKHGLECVICLTPFEDNEVGKILPKCGHGFHVECIDMWLQSHANCPICRAPVLLSNDNKVSVLSSEANSQVSSNLENAGELLNNEVAVNNNLTDLTESAANDDNVSAASASSPLSQLSSSLGCSLKRMLSKNRSERKVFPSSNAGQLEV